METFTVVMEFLVYHVDHEMGELEQPLPKNTIGRQMLCKWDFGFLDRVFSEENLKRHLPFKLFLAATFLQIPSLTILMSAKIATMMKGKMPDQIRAMFYIPETFSNDQEIALKNAILW